MIVCMHPFLQPGEAVEYKAIEQRLAKLERRDWSLWATAVVILLLLAVALTAFSAAWMWMPLGSQERAMLGTAGEGLFGLVSLFALFALYQQYLIKRLRKQLHE